MLLTIFVLRYKLVVVLLCLYSFNKIPKIVYLPFHVDFMCCITHGSKYQYFLRYCFKDRDSTGSTLTGLTGSARHAFLRFSAAAVCDHHLKVALLAHWLVTGVPDTVFILSR